MHRWYLVRTKPSGEEIAQVNLERQGYEVYFPRILQAMRFRQGRRERTYALFPRYLFLHIDESRQSLKPVHSTLGISDVVRFGTRYAIVPDGIVAELRARANLDSGLHQLERLRLSPGERVQVTDGPFRGLEAVFERESGTDRVLVLLELLGQESTVYLPRGHVLPSLAV